MSAEIAPPCKILVLEDNLDTAELTSLILKKFGFEVMTADSVHAALLAVRDARFDVLLCDLSLRDGDGCDFVVQAKAHYPVRAVALTGHGYPIDRQRCEAAGFDAFLLKPVSLNELTAAITSVTADLPCHDESTTSA